MGELKRAQELRVDEKLREGHDTIQKLTSQLQERVICMSDSGEFQDKARNYSGKISHIPSQPAVIPSPRSMLRCDRSMPLDTGNLSETQGNVFLAIHVLCSIQHRHFIGEFFTFRIHVPQVQSQCKKVQGDLSREVKNEFGAQHQC